MHKRPTLIYILIRECLAQGPRSRDDIVEYARLYIPLGEGFRKAERHRVQQQVAWRKGGAPVGRRLDRSLYDQHLTGVRLIVSSCMFHLLRARTVEKLPDGTFKWCR